MVGKELLFGRNRDKKKGKGRMEPRNFFQRLHFYLQMKAVGQKCAGRRGT